MEEPYHQLELTELYSNLLKAAVNGVYYCYLDTGTAFGKKVYQSGIFDMDEFDNFKARLKKEKDKMDLTEAEVTLVYSCHYVQACFANNKEAYFKWFLRFEDQKNAVDDSEDFRQINEEWQIRMAKIIEDSELWTAAMQTRKQQLVITFGELPAVPKL